MEYVNIGCDIILRVFWLLVIMMLLLGKLDYNGLFNKRWEAILAGLVGLVIYGSSIYHEIIDGKWNFILE